MVPLFQTGFYLDTSVDNRMPSSKVQVGITDIKSLSGGVNACGEYISLPFFIIVEHDIATAISYPKLVSGVVNHGEPYCFTDPAGTCEINVMLGNEDRYIFMTDCPKDPAIPVTVTLHRQQAVLEMRERVAHL